MHARVTTFTAKPGKLDEVVKGVNDTMSGVKKNKGFKRGFLLTDKKTGAGLIIGMWDIEANLKAGEDSPYLKEASPSSHR